MKSFNNVRGPGQSFIVALFLLVFGSLHSCKDPFTPDIKFTETNFLVVEGYINVGTDVVTTIHLSRTVPPDEVLAEPSPEEGASVLIEDDLNTTYALTEFEPGVYISDSLSLPLDREYRIRIFSNDESEYVSEFVIPLQTPAIDSVTWIRDGNGVDINVTTHDPQGSIQYYQWDYEEIWELRSPFFSFYHYDLINAELVPRPEQQILNMKKCWARATPSDIKTLSIQGLSSTSASLTLIKIPLFDEKLGENYTVLVRQHALTQPAHNYLEVIRKNTNEVGTFFDPQPSQLIGNISARSSNEPVVGYMGAYTTSEQRIYISNDDVPGWGFDLGCMQMSVSAHPDSLGKYFASGMLTPITYNEPRTAVFATWFNCANCLTRGGDNNKPDFWDDVF